MIRPIIGILLFSLVFIGGAYFVLLSGDKQAQVTSYTQNDLNKPTVQVKESFFDMGTIKASNQKVKDFTIKNIGTKPLQLYNLSSSCGCTTVQIVYQNAFSKEFSMHVKSDYVALIAPQAEAKVRVIYKPYVMPVYGTVGREVYVETNDPVQPKLVFKIKAFVK